MKTRPLFALLVFLAVASSAAAAPISLNELLSRERAKPTEVIHYGAAPHQFGELWLPSGRGPFQTVVLIHGGCWLAELPGTELMAYIADDLRAHGYAVWSIDYRRIGEAGGYAMAAAGSGDNVRELTIRGAGHFELIDPTSEAWTKIRIEVDVLSGRIPPPPLPVPIHPHS